MLEKLLLMEDSMASMAVSIPTKAVIPMAMIIAVSVVRSFWARTEPNATFMFSVRFNSYSLLAQN